MSRRLPVRMFRAFRDTAQALCEYRRDPRDGDDLCDDIAAVWQENFGPTELEFLLSATKRAVHPDVLEAHGFHEIFRDPDALKNVARDTKQRIHDGLRWGETKRQVDYYLRHGWWPEQMGEPHEPNRKRNNANSGHGGRRIEDTAFRPAEIGGARRAG